jgi:hypothetical protein
MTHRIVTVASILALTVLLTGTASLARSGGSPYTRYGIGDLRYASSGQTLALGGTSIAVFAASSAEGLNPAMWGTTTVVRYSFSMMYEGISSTSAHDESKGGTTRFSGLAIVIPVLSDHGVALGLGLTPFSNVQYSIITTSGFSGSPFAVEYSGSGGVSQAYAGLSYRPVAGLFLGAKFTYYFGRLHQLTLQNFPPGSSYVDAQVDRSTGLQGASMTLGIASSLPGKLLSFDEGTSLSAGVIVTTGSSLSSDEEQLYQYNAGSSSEQDTTSIDRQSFALPYAIGAGAAFISGRFMVAADVRYQGWSSSSGTGMILGGLKDNYRYSGGMEWLPRRESSAPLYQRMAYRIGMFNNASYYRINGESISETGFTAGIGIPLFEETRLHITGEYSWRGTTDNQLVKDNIFRLSFTISGGETWFVRPEVE